MNEKVKRLEKKEIDFNLSIVLCWPFLNKTEKIELVEELTFEQWQWLLNTTPPHSWKKAEVWNILKSKADTLEQYQWLWENTPSGSPEEAEAWDMLKTKAEEVLRQ